MCAHDRAGDAKGAQNQRGDHATAGFVIHRVPESATACIGMGMDLMKDLAEPFLGFRGCIMVC